MRWVIVPEEEKMQEASLEECRSCTERQGEIKGKEKENMKKKRKCWRCRSHDATFLQSLLQNDVCQESHIVWKTEVLMRRNQTPDLTESFLQHGIWWYQYHQRFKWQCVSALVISRSVHPGQRTKHKRVNNVTEEIFNM